MPPPCARVIEAGLRPPWTIEENSTLDFRASEARAISAFYPEVCTHSLLWKLSQQLI
jgi:hypothetical protein